MKKLMKIVFCLTIISSLSVAKTPAPKTWTGYLMDKMCSKRMVGNHEKITGHTKTCLTEDGCAGSGYGLMTDKKFIPFDAKGNELAANYIKTFSKDKDFQIKVTGVMKKNKIAVSELN